MQRGITRIFVLTGSSLQGIMDIETNDTTFPGNYAMLGVSISIAQLWLVLIMPSQIHFILIETPNIA